MAEFLEVSGSTFFIAADTYPCASECWMHVQKLFWITAAGLTAEPPWIRNDAVKGTAQRSPLLLIVLKVFVFRGSSKLCLGSICSRERRPQILCPKLVILIELIHQEVPTFAFAYSNASLSSHSANCPINSAVGSNRFTNLGSTIDSKILTARFCKGAQILQRQICSSPVPLLLEHIARPVTAKTVLLNDLLYKKENNSSRVRRNFKPNFLKLLQINLVNTQAAQKDAVIIVAVLPPTAENLDTEHYSISNAWTNHPVSKLLSLKTFFYSSFDGKRLLRIEGRCGTCLFVVSDILSENFSLQKLLARTLELSLGNLI
ncbi:hypothetical protein ACU8KH_00937 [Lachancea thermotolerans]